MTHKRPFCRLGTALVTPFNKKGNIDFDALRALIDFQVENGADFLVPTGTTGESCTLSLKEHTKVIRFTVEVTDGRVPVLAGTGSNSTKEAVELTRSALECGAGGALVVSPYYNKPNRKGIEEYYREVASVRLPVVLYDAPGRTACGVDTDLILQLAHERVICGIKWASGNMDQLMHLLRDRPNDFTVLSGDDALTYALMALGGDGVISVLSNIVPERMSSLIGQIRSRSPEALKTHYELLELMEAMFIDTNPIPAKTALSLIFPNILPAYFRSPMCEMDPEKHEKLKEILTRSMVIC
jgi:4-hydroxy-tetrahydrodipicolinate synthase